MPHHINEPDIIETMGQVEGREWAASERSSTSMYGVLAFVADFADVRVYMDEHGESGEQWEGNLHPAGGDGTIYGDGGYARYRVYGNGEVVLVASNTRPERVAKAVAAGFTVVPQ